MPIEFACGSQTHAGRRRDHNQDAILAGPRIFAVADGMGGHASGDVAAHLAVEALIPLRDAARLDRTDVLDAIRGADAQITQQSSGERAPMGTTLTGVAAIDSSGPEQLLVFNVGDSRTYRVKGGQLVQLTHDHSVVQELIDGGVIDEASASNHPERNVITRSLGGNTGIDIDWWLVEPEAGDRYLVSSDGLSKELAEHEIATVLTSGLPAQATAERLVELALDAGGRDDVSVVVVDILSVTSAEGKTAGPLDDDTNPRSRVPADQR